jgi:hypothetical protein
MGPTSNTKANQGNVSNATNSLNSLAQNAGGGGQQALNKFFGATAGPENFWKTILSGNPTAIMQLMGPSITASNANYDAATNQVNTQMARGGGQVSADANIATQKAGAINNLIQSAQPQAAEQLTNLASLFSQTAIGETGEAISGYGSSAQASLGQEQVNLQQQQMLNQLIAGLAQGAGSAAGGIFFGKG